MIYPKPVVSWEEALHRLQEGNKRFATGQSAHPHQSSERREQMLAGQHPFAAVLCCSDSRVPPELLFDQGMGDLFVVRVAGNVVDDGVLGSISYSVNHLKIPLVLVLGHEDCGAVTATLQSQQTLSQAPPEIQHLMRRIVPAIEGLPYTTAKDEKLARSIEANTRQSVRQLQQASCLHQALQQGETRILGGIYSLGTGKVQILAEGR